MSKFDPADSLGALSAPQISEYLTGINDLKGAARYVEGLAGGQGLIGALSPYDHTGAVLGYIPPGGRGPRHDIVGISQIPGDKTLVGKRIKITMDKFYVHNYPGLGSHNILCEFSGRNQAKSAAEPLQFALRFRARDKDAAAIGGVPLFLGLTVGANGISFEGRTINVSSSGDETVLSTLDSPAFQSGLKLLTTTQPALKPLSSLAEAVVKNVLKRNFNKQVHSFDLGLDFSENVSSARLQLGTYIVVQSNLGGDWGWSSFVWNADAQVLQAKDPASSVDFNYMAFGISDYVADPED